MSPMTSQRTGTLGTFAGVFTPSILTILGIILFLRLGTVVGSVGIGQALLIIGLATLISVVTSMSLAAIATNIRVRGGGDYYLISRTLGVEFGGSIGIVLFLAQSVSVAFYALGFGEALSAIIRWDNPRAAQLIAVAAISGLFVLAWLGADWASRFQYVVMALLVAALASFFLGAIPGADAGLLSENVAPPEFDVDFWAAFALFFPAVTGFTQGVSMSGDLRDPAKSLPRGTFAAVGISTVVYLAVAVLFAANRPLAELASNAGAMGDIARWSWLISGGVIAATLSSAMASFLGAPRILQSLASDKVFGFLNFFAKGAGPTNNPQRGVLLTLGIALATVALGALDAIAAVVAMFFLISYGLLNYATYYEAQASSPSFRPRFRYFSKRVSLLGAVASLGAMVLINPIAGAAAAAVLFGLYRYVASTHRADRWSDASHSHYFQRARGSIRSMAREWATSRDWRPVVMAFSDDRHRRGRLLTFAEWIEGRSGLAMAVRIIEGSGIVKRRERDEAAKELAEEVAALGVDVHPLVVLSEDPAAAVPIIVQSAGVGPIKPNIVLVNWLENVQGNDPRQAAWGTALQGATRSGASIVALSSGSVRWDTILDAKPSARRIDIWWRPNDASCRLILLLAYLCTRTETWRDAAIRLITAPEEGKTDAELQAELAVMLDEARIPAQVTVVEDEDSFSFAKASVGASVVFLPFRLHRGNPISQFGESPADLLNRLPVAAMVLAAEDVELLESGPESGPAGELAEADKALDTAQEREAELVVTLEDLTAELEALDTSNTDERATLEEGIEEAKRKLGKAKARREEAEKRLAALAPPPSGTL